MGKKNSEKEKPEVELNFGGKGLVGGFFKGLSNLIDLADKVSREGGVIEKTGEFGVKGQKDLSGVYGFSFKTMVGPGGSARPVVQPFGDVSKVKKTYHPKGPLVEEAREPLVDVFDEGEFIRIVAELPGTTDAEIKTEVKGHDVLQIQSTGKKKYSKELLLISHVEPGNVERKYTNGVLEIKLKKTVVNVGGDTKKPKKITNITESAK